MMNAARLGVGLEGLGIAEAATQAARKFAHERFQGKIGSQPVVIATHPDVHRMLTFMESHTQGLRALASYTGALSDIISAHPDEAERIRAANLLDLLTPVMKSHTTAIAFAIASEAIQIHGGMGYIEETGVAQYLRDVRVTMIYEGTNGIQALDLVSRKLAMNGGDVFRDLLGEIESFTQKNAKISDSCFKKMLENLNIAISHTREAGEYLLNAAYPDTAAQASSFLTLLGLLMESYLLIKGAVYATSLKSENDPQFTTAFLDKQIALAQFFASDTLLDTFTLKKRIKLGIDSIRPLFVRYT